MRSAPRMPPTTPPTLVEAIHARQLAPASSITALAGASAELAVRRGAYRAGTDRRGAGALDVSSGGSVTGSVGAFASSNIAHRWRA
jgi:hypothetical protein